MDDFRCPEGHDGSITLAQDCQLEAWVKGWHNGNLVIGAFQDVTNNKTFTVLCRHRAGMHEIEIPDVAILQNAPTYLHDRLEDVD
jgi:hypothetical protein